MPCLYYNWTEAPEDYSFMLFIVFLNLAQSIDLARSRCRGNVCGMKELSAVGSHRGRQTWRVVLF